MKEGSGEKICFPGITEELKSFNLGILIIGAFYTLEFGSLQGLYPIVHYLKIPTIVAMAAVAYAVYLTVTGQFKLRRLNVLYLLFCMFLITNSFLLTINPDLKSNIFKLLLTYICCYIIAVSTIRDLNGLMLLLDILLASMAYSSLHGMLQGGLLWGSQWISDENIYAVFCCIGLPFAYVLLGQSSSILKKSAYSLCLFLFTVGIFLAGSRGGFLTLGIVLIIFFWYSRKKFYYLLFIALIISVGFSFAPSGVFQELENIDQDEQEGSAGERMYLWRLAYNMFSDNKIVGVGLGNYGECFLKYDQEAESRDELGGVNWRGMKYVAHSTPLTFLAETGLVGIALLSALLFHLFSSLIRGVRSNPENIIGWLCISTITALLAFWVGSAFLTLSVYPFFYNLVILSGVLISLSLVNANSQESQVN